MFPKKKRVTDEKFLKKVREQPCIFCMEQRVHQIHPTEADHITTRGSGGGDTETNVWPVCRLHHQERHRIGILTFIQKYRSARIFLRIMGRRDLLDKVGEGT